MVHSHITYAFLLFKAHFYEDNRMSYQEFLKNKSHAGTMGGFDPVWMPDFLFDFQKELTTWAIQKGRAAIFADCGLGKTPMQLVWAENITRKENGNVLIVTPLAVSAQTVREGDKFSIEARRSLDGTVHKGITVTNYERLHYFKPSDFVGMVCDESSILKNFSGVRRGEITEFMKKMKYRLLCTATASPNDYVELGTSSEALGELGNMDMLGMFFKTSDNALQISQRYGDFWNRNKWRFKAHAEEGFWRWVCSWARAIRRPSDLGFEDGTFKLPPMNTYETVVINRKQRSGELFTLPAIGLDEQREERRLTVNERCEEVARLVNHNRPALVWCQMNEEADLLEKIIPDAKQIQGSDSDDYKEKTFLDFANGDLRVLVTKPKIGAFGLNFQHCSDITFFPSHSFEQYYQGVRRCWRFGQKRPVRVDIVTTEGEMGVLKNLQRKAEAADVMFSSLVAAMCTELKIEKTIQKTIETEAPSWL
jgi:SNF2 family DNA or RNA helicase